jgi:AcrR family transcriptional regulator
MTVDAEQAVREVRTRWRRRQLLDAAARLMVRSGFHGVSMQALADEAEVSVGLIYRYFGGKEAVLLAVITEVLDAFAERVPAAMDGAGDDPVERVAAGFRCYCEVIDENRHAAVLTYQESKTLTDSGRAEIKKREIESGRPLREAITEATAAGLLVAFDADLLAYDLMLLAQAWALKHWYFERNLDLATYIRRQTALALRSAVEPARRENYRHLLEG